MEESFFVTSNGEFLKVSDISFIGKLDRHIKHGSGSAHGNTTHFFLVVVGGQSLEIKNNDIETVTSDRVKLIDMIAKLP